MSNVASKWVFAFIEYYYTIEKFRLTLPTYSISQVGDHTSCPDTEIHDTEIQAHPRLQEPPGTRQQGRQLGCPGGERHRRPEKSSQNLPINSP